MFVDLVEAQQVDHRVLIHGIGDGLGLAATVIHILDAHAKPQALGEAVLELIGVEQAEAVARDIGQARAGWQAIVLGHLGIDVGVTTDHSPLGGDVAGDVDVQATAADLAGGQVRVGVDRVQRQHVLLDDMVDRRIDAELPFKGFPLQTQLVRLAFFRLETEPPPAAGVPLLGLNERAVLA